MSNDILAQWEMEWVLKHPERYRDFQHQVEVCARIFARYKVNEYKASFMPKLQRWAKTKYVKDELILLEHFGLENESIHNERKRK